MYLFDLDFYKCNALVLLETDLIVIVIWRYTRHRDYFFIFIPYQVELPKTVEAIARVNKLSGSLHAVFYPCTHKYHPCISVHICSHTVAKIFLPRALVDVIIHIVISAEAVFCVMPPFP